MKIMTCFVDASAWLAILDKSDPHHQDARKYFEQLLEKDSKLVTNNIAIDETINRLKMKSGAEMAREFYNIIDESILTINLRMDWISRRIRKNALNHFLKSKEGDLQLRHFLIFETIKRKRVDIVFTFDRAFRLFDLPLMPHA